MRRLTAVVLLLMASGPSFAGSRVITLEEAVETALSNNLEITAGEEKILQAEYEKREARTFFLPRVSSSFSYTRMNEARETMGMKVMDANLYNLGITLLHPLYTGGKLDAVYGQAKENVKRSGYEQEAVMQNLAAETKKGYFSILKAMKGVETALKQKEMAQEHLRKTELLFREGMVTKIDVLKTEVFLSEIEQAILKTNNSVSLAKAGLGFLLNMPLSEQFDVEDILDAQKEKHDLEHWTGLSYENRPEIKQMESISRIYGYNTEIEKSSRRPQVSLLSSYNFQKGSVSPVDKWDNSWNIGLAVELDVWNWGETRERIEKTIHAKREIDTQYELLKKAIELEVKSAYLNLETASQQIETSKKSLEKAQENLRVANLLYGEGMSNTTDVLDAQADLAAAMGSYHQSLYDYQIAYAELEKSAGVHMDRSGK
ncbi:MAG TPA: TolC family protein [bacterium]|nr:TolC family protein [bacterium]